ncbi:MAG TPA: hotdog fold thioesterase [Syntrophomonadaceae bacterium]|nr:hotdog fold thioesterase [Syntrophomonadaceae bacterium]
MVVTFDWKGTIMETLGIEVTEYTREKVVATMPVKAGVYQPFGLLHGGVSAVLAETVASAGSYLFIDPATQRAVGLEINANHLRSVNQGTVRAVGMPVHTGGRTIVWDVRIYDQEDKIVCISRCTVAIVDQVDSSAGQDAPNQ